MLLASKLGLAVSPEGVAKVYQATTKAPVTANAGFDMGKPYSGTSKLVGMTADTLFWEYTEESRGESTTYRNSERMVDPTTFRTSVRKDGSDAKPWVSERTRVNHLKAHGLDALIGQWMLDMPDGSAIQTSTNIIGWRMVA